MGAEKPKKAKKEKKQKAALASPDQMEEGFVPALNIAELTKGRKEKRKHAEGADPMEGGSMTAEEQMGLPKAKKQKQKHTHVDAAGAPEHVSMADVNKSKLKRTTKPKAEDLVQDMPSSEPAVTCLGQQVKKKKAKDDQGAQSTEPAPAEAIAAEVQTKKKAKKLNIPPAEAALNDVVSAAPEAIPALERGKKAKKAQKAPAGAAAAAEEPAALLAEAAADGLKAKKSNKKKRAKHGDAMSAPSMAAEEALAPCQPASTNGPSEKQRPDKKEMKKKRKAKEACAPAVEPESKTSAANKAAAVQDEVQIGEQQVGGSGRQPGGRSDRAPRAFQRVKAEEWLGKKGAWDNSYEATFGSSGWGAGAQAILGQVRGKDFRHEKTKKKRGSYKGGVIDHAVNSFKFDSDDE